MKSLFVPIVIVLSLIVFFVMIDRMEFGRNIDIQTVQSESSTANRKPSVFLFEKTIAEEKPPVETKPKTIAETKPQHVSDEKPRDQGNARHRTLLAETELVAETKVTIGQSAETEMPPEKRPTPAAVPVVTEEEAEKLNAEALVEFERQEKIREKARKRLNDGYGLTYTENFKEGRIVSISKANEEQLIKKGYNLDEFKKREIPKVWNIDFSTIPSDTLFSPLRRFVKKVHSPSFVRLFGRS